VTKSPVSASRKLFVAVLLLIGGYGTATLFGRLTDSGFAGASAVSSSATPAEGSATASQVGDSTLAASAAGRLVPESPLAANSRNANQPTWLTATPDLGSSQRLASQPASAPPPPSIDTNWSANRLESIEVAPPLASAAESGAASLAAQSAAPKARITNVVVSSTPANPAAASPWDRWPRWDANSGAAERGPVAATFQDVSAATAKPMQATFDDAELVSKNSPPRDLGPTVDAPSGRTHVVVDGDSLVRLAERYLDDPALAGEIYRLNRDVLQSPELLPIGVELKIPDTRMADTASLPFASNSSASTRHAPSGMVPVDWAPRSFDGPPRAELLHPIAAHRD
jgi:hypothetical protein